ARLNERLQEEYSKRVAAAESEGLPPPAPPAMSEPGKYSKSYVSEEGGMLGPASEGDGAEQDEADRPAKRLRRTSVAGSSNHHEADVPPAAMISDRQYVEHTPGAVPVDLNALRTSPHEIPFIGIHSPGPNIATKTKAISRQHLKIQFNKEK